MSSPSDYDYRGYNHRQERRSTMPNMPSSPPDDAASTVFESLWGSRAPASASTHCSSSARQQDDRSRPFFANPFGASSAQPMYDDYPGRDNIAPMFRAYTWDETFPCDYPKPRAGPEDDQYSPSRPRKQKPERTAPRAKGSSSRGNYYSPDRGMNDGNGSASDYDSTSGYQSSESQRGTRGKSWSSSKTQHTRNRNYSAEGTFHTPKQTSPKMPPRSYTENCAGGTRKADHFPPDSSSRRPGHREFFKSSQMAAPEEERFSTSRTTRDPETGSYKQDQPRILLNSASRKLNNIASLYSRYAEQLMKENPKPPKKLMELSKLGYLYAEKGVERTIQIELETRYPESAVKTAERVWLAHWFAAELDSVHIANDIEKTDEVKNCLETIIALSGAKQGYYNEPEDITIDLEQTPPSLFDDFNATLEQCTYWTKESLPELQNHLDHMIDLARDKFPTKAVTEEAMSKYYSLMLFHRKWLQDQVNTAEEWNKQHGTVNLSEADIKLKKVLDKMLTQFRVSNRDRPFYHLKPTEYAHASVGREEPASPSRPSPQQDYNFYYHAPGKAPRPGQGKRSDSTYYEEDGNNGRPTSVRANHSYWSGQTRYDVDEETNEEEEVDVEEYSVQEEKKEVPKPRRRHKYYD